MTTAKRINPRPRSPPKIVTASTRLPMTDSWATTSGGTAGENEARKNPGSSANQPDMKRAHFWIGCG